MTRSAARTRTRDRARRGPRPASATRSAGWCGARQDPDGGEGAGQRPGQAGRRDQHEDGADDAERRIAALDGALDDLPGLLRQVDRVGEPVAVGSQVAIRISIGSTEVKNWAAMVIDRSNTSIRTSPAVPWSMIRPGHRSSSQATRRCSPAGSRPSAASARARAAASCRAGGGSVRLSAGGARRRVHLSSSRRSLGPVPAGPPAPAPAGGWVSGFPEIRGRAHRRAGRPRPGVPW